MAELTPMMRQYMDVKEQNPDSLLFFRLGDFYEMFGADARTASQELDLALTTRDKDKTKAPEDKIPMCGIPYHSADAYIARLIAKGYKVSICEQTEDPALAKGLVQREVIRTVTPGTVLDDACLDAGRSNYLCGVYLSDTAAGLCACDVSTGQAHVTVFTGEQRITGLINELGRFAPAEAVMNAAAYDNAELAAALENRFACRRERLGDGRYDLRDAEKKVRTQFGEEALSRLPRNDAAPLLALGGLLTYLYETQKTDLKQLDKLEWYRTGQFMELDLAARRNLELTETLRSKEKKGSLLWVLDRTKTPMGARNLRMWLQQPLMNVAAIDRRLNAVAALVDNTMGRQELRLAMTGMGDMERLMSRIVYGTAGARDLVSLRAALEHLPEVKRCLEPFSTGALAKLGEQLETLEDISGRIAATLVDEPPFSVREGGMIREGFHPEVDHLRTILTGGKGFIAELEAREKEKNRHPYPEGGVQQGIRLLHRGVQLLQGAGARGLHTQADAGQRRAVHHPGAEGSGARGAHRPRPGRGAGIRPADRPAQRGGGAGDAGAAGGIADRPAGHPVRLRGGGGAEPLLPPGRGRVRRDRDRGGTPSRCGENAGRRLFSCPTTPTWAPRRSGSASSPAPTWPVNPPTCARWRSSPLMAQVGSFVPAQRAHIGVVDRIFTRIGASDDLAAGQSTFMVEMTEVSELLRCATKNSLLILDEIGRGTSTFDGMSIARAVLEYCAGKLKAKTLFATHYHELTALEQELPNVRNYNVAVHARGEDIVFLRKIVPGGADRSYGIEVAKLAGLPDAVLKRAREILRELESQSAHPHAAPVQDDQLSLGTMAESAVADVIRRTQVDALSPLEALNLLYELKSKLQ